MSSTKTSDKVNAAPPALHGVRLHARPNAKLIRARKHFDGLLAKVRTRRREYGNWVATAATLREMARTTLDPMSGQFGVYIRQLILVLHQAHGHPALDDSERATLSGFICELAEDVLRQDDDGEFEQIYNLHSGSDYQSDRARQEEDMAEMRDKFHQLQLGQMGDGGAGAGGAADAADADDGGASRQATVDALYGRLGAAIRALPPAQQQDLQERLDAAYVDSDVTGCMMLDIELDQLRQPGAGAMDRDQLLRHCGVLEDYIDGLEFETVGIQFSLIIQLQLPGGQPLTERIGRECLLAQKAFLEEELEHLACDVADFQDIAKLKVWVKARQEYDERRTGMRH